jgi:predicted  nucleic acid-binding Zn-ribbon protein
MEEKKELNVKENIEHVQNEIFLIQSSLRDFKKTVTATAAEVAGMEAKIELLINDTPKSFFPQIEEIFRDLKNEMVSQKVHNENLQKQITDLKKERSVIAQHVVASNTKVSILNEKVGFISKYDSL